VKTRFYRSSTPKIYPLLAAISIRPNVIIVPLENEARVKPVEHIPADWLRNNPASQPRVNPKPKGEVQDRAAVPTPCNKLTLIPLHDLNITPIQPKEV
jgi:hypothetical protein